MIMLRLRVDPRACIDARSEGLLGSGKRCALVAALFLAEAMRRMKREAMLTLRAGTPPRVPAAYPPRDRLQPLQPITHPVRCAGVRNPKFHSALRRQVETRGLVLGCTGAV